MKVYEVLAAVQGFAPEELCASWDNAGFLVGNIDDEVDKIYVCLDVTAETVADAKAQGCSLIVSHHPLIFGKLRRVVASDYEGALLLEVIKNDISVIAAHTNFDSAEHGVNYVLATALGLENVRMFDDDPDNPSFIGRLPAPIIGSALAELVKAVLGIPVVKAAGLSPDAQYRTIAVCGGAGSDLWQAAQAAGAEAYVTSDCKHHSGLQATAAGLAVFDGGHFPTENLAMPLFAEQLQKALPTATIVLSALRTDPWRWY